MHVPCATSDPLAEFVVHVAQPPSPTSDASAPGNTPTPTSPKASANIFPSWLKDPVATWVLPYEIAGMITRADAQRISAYTDRDAADTDLNETIEKHRLVHLGLGLSALPLLPATADEAELKSAHSNFLRTLRRLNTAVSASFSRGEITLPVALWLDGRQADARDIEMLSENDWKIPQPASANSSHPHSSGGITLASV